LVAAPPCLSIISLRHPPVTLGPKSHLLRLRAAHLPGPHLCSSLLLQVVQLVSHSKATARRTTCLPDTTLLATQRLLAVLQWHMSVDTVVTVDTYLPTRWHCQATASAEHLAAHHLIRHLFHRLVATTALPHREVGTQNTTATALLLSAHQATPGAVSMATARLA
jgi:hypothetical protein